MRNDNDRIITLDEEFEDLRITSTKVPQSNPLSGDINLMAI